MKVRNGFVSNSSSSSFVISLTDISAAQLKKIVSYKVKAKKLRLDYWDYPWDIEVEDEYVRGKTYMDNFNMETYLTNIVGIPKDKIKWIERGC